ncbi:MAG: hypothetical protein PHH73_03915 [Candidatus Rickettsiella isopodorum]|nr:hypothetical protein [Candidatus Rickettsiella isopodorum]
MKKAIDTGYGTSVRENELLEREAEIALEMIIRWGLVSAMPDGEDSTGRQRMRLLDPIELVDRAYETANLFMIEARKRNLILFVPEKTVELPSQTTGTAAKPLNI